MLEVYWLMERQADHKGSDRQKLSISLSCMSEVQHQVGCVPGVVWVTGACWTHRRWTHCRSDRPQEHLHSQNSHLELRFRMC